MLEELEALFIHLDKVKGRATASLGKGELGDAPKAFFRVLAARWQNQGAP